MCDEELYPLLTQNSFGLSRSNFFVALPPTPAPWLFLCFSFLAVRWSCWQENPPHPAQSWPRYRDGLERWAWAKWWGKKGSDGKGRGLLGALLSWQEEGGGGWLRRPIASPPVPRKTTVRLPEIKNQPWIFWAQAPDARNKPVTILDPSYCI